MIERREHLNLRRWVDIARPAEATMFKTALRGLPPEKLGVLERKANGYFLAISEIGKLPRIGDPADLSWTDSRYETFVLSAEDLPPQIKAMPIGEWCARVMKRHGLDVTEEMARAGVATVGDFISKTSAQFLAGGMGERVHDLMTGVLLMHGIRTVDHPPEKPLNFKFEKHQLEK